MRKTLSGLVKLIYPNGQLSKEELAELVELSLEGRRRVKEQLKKMGSFEFHQTSFSLIDNETREEKFVGVPEQGGRDMISLDPLAPGSVYTSSVDDHAKVGLCRLEVGCSPREHLPSPDPLDTTSSWTQQHRRLGSPVRAFTLKM